MRSSSLLALLSRHSQRSAPPRRIVSGSTKRLYEARPSAAKRYLTAHVAQNNALNWAPIALAAAAGASASFLSFYEADAADNPLTVEVWKKPLDSVLKLDPNKMDWDALLDAIEELLKTYSKIPSEELLPHIEQVHRVFVKIGSVFSELGMLEDTLRTQELFLRMCELHGVSERFPDIYSYSLNEVGETYRLLDNDASASKFYEQNIKFNEKSKRSGKLAISQLVDLQLAYGKLALCHMKMFLRKKRNSGESEGGNADTLQAVPPNVSKLLQLQQNVMNQIAEREDAKRSKTLVVAISVVNTLLEMAHLVFERQMFESGLDYFAQAKKVCEDGERLAAKKVQEKASEKSGFFSFGLQSSTNDSSDESSELPSLIDTKESIDLARTSFLTRMGRYEEARKEVEILLASQINRLGKNSFALIPTYNNLGHILASQGRWEDSENALLKAIDLTLKQQQHSLGKRGGSSVLGGFMSETGGDKKSSKSSSGEISSKFDEVMLTEEHLAYQFGEKLYLMQSLLGNVLRAQGKMEHALDVCEANVKLGDGVFGNNTKESAQTYFALASLLAEMGQQTRALEAYSKAYNRAKGASSSQSSHEHHDPRLPVTLLSIGREYSWALIKQKKNLDAEQIILETRNLVSNTYGAHSRMAAANAHISGEMYATMGELAKATSQFQLAISLLQSLPASSARDTQLAHSQLAIGSLLALDHKFPEAKPYLDTALQLSKKVATSSEISQKFSNSNSGAKTAPHASSGVGASQTSKLRTITRKS